ncbi:serine/threonine-protein kinase SBK1-like [Ascaphus truei]|uniref:serine/threonine-protein kinase SBK1-like n=1 Tax=Ascaphus truei TaxID=8439 RepID=UPI003F5A58BF
MAATIQEITKEMAKLLLHLISLASKNLKRLELTDHYDPIRDLGKGSYGNVLMAKHRKSGQAVALKMMGKNKTGLENFLQEFAISIYLCSHPHIIGTYGVAFDTVSHFVFVQEVGTAGNLLSIIQPKVGIREELVKRCVVQLASALEFMHSKGLVHRDIKTDNILLMDRECHCIKLADFGLTQLQSTRIPSMSFVIPYMPPEISILEPSGQLILHHSLDVWSFGVLVYIALTGCFPWNGAVLHDQKYREYVSWQFRKDISQAPTGWKKFTPEAKKMFFQVLAPCPTERCSVMEVVKYIHFPWKVEILPDDIARNSKTMQESKRPHNDRTEATTNSSSMVVLENENPSLSIGAEVELT